MMLRPYQQRAHDAAIQWMRRSLEPCLIEAVTGAGKSHLLAAIAQTIGGISGKRMLILQPAAELLDQNKEKYLATGNPCSVFSASRGSRSTQHGVVFGTPGTVKNAVSRFGADYGLVLIDEAHGITPTIKRIIERMREANPKLRVCGMTATPYRLGSGYIYRTNEAGKAWAEDKAKDPYFARRVANITARELLDSDYLTPPLIGAIGTSGYDTSNLVVNRMGQFDAQAVDAAFVGHGRKTALIVQDVLHASVGRKGIMFFAATVQHAGEVLASLPAHNSAIVTGTTPKDDRASILRRYKAGEIRHLVSVAVLTTGFDAPHTDVIALLRATESVGLMQQIIGRGMRIAKDKKDFLVLDYAENIQRHCPDGDLFAPEVKASHGGGIEGGSIEACCPLCTTTNTFTARPNDGDFAVGADGYFVDSTSQHILNVHGPVPAHFGRQCFGTNKFNARCTYRWTFKACPKCDGENDIAARYCSTCKNELIDPNEKLIADYVAHKKDPTQLQIDALKKWQVTPTISQAGNETIKVTYTTEYRSFTVWMKKGGYEHNKWANATCNGANRPTSVTYRKKGDWYEVLGFNQPPDTPPERPVQAHIQRTPPLDCPQTEAPHAPQFAQGASAHL